MRQSSVLSLIVVLHLTCGCGTKVPTREIERMLDAREYREVIDLLEAEVEADPKSSSAVPLAKAHLGIAGLESLDLISRVLGLQTESPELSRLVPQCPVAQVITAESLEIRCVVLRIFKNLPAPDNQHLVRAQEILTRGLPTDAKSTPEKDNLLSVYIELVITLAKTRDVLLRYEAIDPKSATQTEVEWFFSVVSEIAQSADKILTRAKFIPRNVSHLLTGKSRHSLIAYRAPSLEFIQQTALPQLIKVSQGRPSDPDVALQRVNLIYGLDDAVRALKPR